jgi:hypothetical protein
MNAVPYPICTALIITWVLAVGLGGCGKTAEEPLPISGPTMGTYYDIKIAQTSAGISTLGIQQGVEGGAGQGRSGDFDLGSVLGAFAPELQPQHGLDTHLREAAIGHHLHRSVGHSRLSDLLLEAAP